MKQRSDDVGAVLPGLVSGVVVYAHEVQRSLHEVNLGSLSPTRSLIVAG
jgi:hypothetical protein